MIRAMRLDKVIKKKSRFETENSLFEEVITL